MHKYKSLKKVVVIIAFTCIGFTLHAQQQGQYSQYMMNYFLVNPAVAGTEDMIDVRVGYRMQWAGLSNSPRNYYASAHFPINKVHAKVMRQRKKPDAYHVMGGIFSGQKLGAISHNSGYLTYAYHLPLSTDWILSMGAQAGMNQIAVDGNALNFGDNIADPVVVAGLQNKMKFDMGLGLWLYSPKIFIGLSSMQILQSKIDFNAVGGTGLLNRHYILTGGYKIQVNQDVKIIPSVLLKQTATAFQMDINTKVRYKNLFWAGMSYRRQDAVVVLAGVGIPLTDARSGSSRIEIGYSYDLSTSKLSGFNKGSHEIMLALILPMGGRVICPSDYW